MHAHNLMLSILRKTMIIFKVHKCPTTSKYDINSLYIRIKKYINLVVFFIGVGSVLGKKIHYLLQKRNINNENLGLTFWGSIFLKRFFIFFNKSNQIY